MEMCKGCNKLSDKGSCTMYAKVPQLYLDVANARLILNMELKNPEAELE